MTGRLSDRRSLVTGAADGIGEATARLFAAEGARVLAVDVAADKLAAAWKGVAGVTPFAIDIAAEGASRHIIEAASASLGALDIVVNCAGITAAAPVGETDDALWRRILEVNLTAMFRICRDALPLLKQSAHPRIVNIGSILSSFACAGFTAYTTSKHGVAGLTKSLATELGGAGVRVNYIQPGAIVTGMTRDSFSQNPAAVAYWTGKSASGRLGQPIDIARVALFLASDDADFISGQGILVDGGASQSI